MNARIVGAVLIGLVGAGASRAGEPCKECPPSQYAPAHYWAPGWYRAKACLHGDTMNKEPCLIPAPIMATRFPCPTATPAVMYEHSVYRLFEYRGPAAGTAPASRAPKGMTY